MAIGEDTELGERAHFGPGAGGVRGRVGEGCGK